MHYDDRCDGALGWAHGDCTEIRTDRKTDAGNTAVYQFSVSTDSEGASCEGVYFHESDRQCAGAWLGVYAGGAEGDGGAGEAGGGTGESGICHSGQRAAETEGTGACR